MADIHLVKPEAQVSQTILSAPDGHFIFDFPADSAVLSRAGDDLLLTFEDGAVLRLQGFYTTYSKDTMPSFEVDGAQIAGEDFFMAMNEPDLMPAAGPGRSAAQSNGNRFHDYVTGDLLDGLDRLGGLEIGWPGSDVTPETDGGATTSGDDIDYGVTLTPGNPGHIDGNTPVIDNPDNPHDGDAGAAAGRDVLRVQESGLRGEGNVTASSFMAVNAPDGVSSIVIGGIVVFDGALTGATVPTDEGYLEVTGFDATTGRLDYTFHLTQATQEHKGDGTDSIAHDLVVTVTDSDGSTGSGVVSVVITDDVPTAKADSVSLTEAQAQAGGSWGNVLTNDVFGADAPLHETVTSIKNGTLGNPVSGQYGQLMLQADGTYTYRLNPDVDVPNGQVYTETFTYTITDTDGDTSEAVLTIAITGDTIVPAVTVDKPATGEADIVVDEGVQPEHGGESHAQSGSGSFNVYLYGEDGTIEVGGFTISIAGDEALISGTAQSVHGVQLSNVRASLEDGKWTVQYDYELTGGNQLHGTDAETDASLKGEFAITVTDATGDMASGSLVVEVHDDVPQVTVNQGTIDMGMDEAAIRDGAPVSVSVSDQFQSNPGADGMQSQKYELTLSDNAGEANKGLMAIVDGKPVPVTLAPGADSEGRSVIVGTAGETGETVFTVHVDAQGNVTVELLKPLYHDAQNTDTLSIHGIGVKLTVTDTDGDSSSDELGLNLTVRDDVPGLTVKSEPTETGNDTAESSLSGTFTVDFGADGPGKEAALAVDGRPVAIDGTTTLAFDDGGKLVITSQGDGTYRYVYTHADPDVTFKEKQFTVTATDGDSDIAQSVITVGQDFHPTTPDGQSGEDLIHQTVTTDESYLSSGSQAGQDPGDGITDEAEGNFTVNLHGEHTETTITVTYGETALRFQYDGVKWGALGSDSDAVIQGQYGDLSVWVENSDANNVTIYYNYKQTSAYKHPENEAAATAADSFGIRIEDGEDKPLTGTVNVNIVDDVPTLTVEALTGAYGDGISGKVDFNFGADNGEGSKIELSVNGGALVEGVSTDGGQTYSFAVGSQTVTLNATTGEFYYALPVSGSDAEYTFTFTVTDADGDVKSNLEPVRVKVDKTNLSGITGHATSNDANVLTGDEVSVEMPTLPEGVTLVANQQVKVTLDGVEYGTLRVDTEGNVTFIQEKAYSGDQHTEQGEGEVATGFSGNLAVSLADGTSSSITVTVNIQDDMPSISVTQQATGSYGKPVTGSVDMSFGADNGEGAKIELSVNDGVVVEGEKGADGNYTFSFDDGCTLTLDGTTGAFSYSGIPTSGTGTKYTFTFTVTDADGDTATATAIAEIAPKASYHGTVTSSDNDTLKENGNKAHSITVTGNPELKSIIAGQEVRDQNEQVIGEFSIDGNKLFFTQTAPYTHSGDEGSSATLTPQLTVKDAYDNEHIISVEITIEDSVPIARNDAIELKQHGKEGNPDAQGNVLENDTQSADSPTLVTAVADAEGKEEPVNAYLGATIEGKLGTLHINVDGTYTYTLHEGYQIPENTIVREEFTYTIKDADGDSSTAAALTILVGQGTIHVQESGYGLNEQGEDAEIQGTLKATGHVIGTVTAVQAGSTQYTDLELGEQLGFELTSPEDNGDTFVIHTTYGDLTVTKSSGEYRFELNDEAANPMPNGFEIHQSFFITTEVEGVSTPQEIVVVIKGTNDRGWLDEAGEGGHAESQLWIDAKAEGADTIERPYDATWHPNLGETDSSKEDYWKQDLDQQAGGTARPVAWFPFTLSDPDVSDSLSFEAVYNGADNKIGDGPDMTTGMPFVTYQQLLAGMNDAPLSMALSVEWGKFQQNFTDAQLDNMHFFRNDYGIFIITNEAVELKALNNLEGAQYWLTFLVDSDADAIREMAEGTGTDVSNGKILHFSFQVKDGTGNTVQSSTGTGGYADTNHVLVHVYGSNDTPELSKTSRKTSSIDYLSWQ